VMAVLSFLLSLLFSKVFSQDGVDCEWQDPSTGAQFDLTKLTLSEGFYSTTVGQFYWELNVCGIIPTIQCVDDMGMLCQYEQGTFISAWATWGNTNNPDLDVYPTWSLIQPGNATAGVQMNFTNGVPYCTYQGRRYNRSSLVKFICNPSRKEATNFSVYQDITPCLWVVELESEYGCPVVAESSTTKKLSFGSILLIVVAIFIPLYIIIGCIYNSKKHDTKGTESCPNVEFWRDLPSLVREGFRFTFRGCKKGSGNEYQDL